MEHEISEVDQAVIIRDVDQLCVRKIDSEQVVVLNDPSRAIRVDAYRGIAINPEIPEIRIDNVVLVRVVLVDQMSTFHEIEVPRIPCGCWWDLTKTGGTSGNRPCKAPSLQELRPPTTFDEPIDTVVSNVQREDARAVRDQPY